MVSKLQAVKSSQVKSSLKKIKHNGTVHASSLTEQTVSVKSLSVHSSNCVQRPGPANNDVANARAQDVEIMRAHRLLHARKAGLTSVGCSSRARELARLSTNGLLRNSTCLPLFQGHDDKAAPIASLQTTQRILSPCLPRLFRKRCRPLSRSRPGLSVARQGAL